MIHLRSLTIIGLLLLCPALSFTQSVQPNFQIPTEPQDEAAKLKRADELLQKALFVEIEFTGNKNSSSQTLLEQMERSRDPNQSGQMILAGPLYLDHLQDDFSRIRYFLGTKGYLQAVVGEPQIKDLGERIAKVTVPIKEGPRYRIGQIIVKGASVISPTEIIEMSGLRQGEVTNSDTIQDKVYKGIKDAYADRGYIQASVDFTPEFKLPYSTAPEGFVDVTLEVDEGKMFFVECIDLSGDFSDRIKSNKQKILDCLLMKDGDVYSRRLFDETLKNLNGLGWFEESREKDVVTRIMSAPDKGQHLEIKIKVKEIEPLHKQ